MNSDNPLDPVYKAFSVASDCFKVATRTIQVQHEELIRRTQFIGAAEEEANMVLRDAAKQVGQVKQIKQYRDWIAHQNPNKPTPTQATPETAFDVLTRMIEQIRLTHTPPAEPEVAQTAIG